MRRKQRIPRQSFLYQQSLVTYLDVLGMKDLVRAAGSDANKVGRVLSLARSFSRPDKMVAQSFRLKSVNFSDLVLRTVPINSIANKQVRIGLVFHELFDLAIIQLRLVLSGILIRGAMTYGDISTRNGLVFGPSLISAYKLESTTSIYPRIIIHEKVFREMKCNALLRRHDYAEELKYIRGMISRDEDGRWFVDYLKFLAGNADDEMAYLRALQDHKTIVERHMRSASLLDGRTRDGKSRKAKASWLKKYHNAHVRQIRGPILMGSITLESLLV